MNRSFYEGQRVRFREPLVPDLWSEGYVMYVLSTGAIGIRPDGCAISRVLCESRNVEAIDA